MIKKLFGLASLAFLFVLFGSLAACQPAEEPAKEEETAEPAEQAAVEEPVLKDILETVIADGRFTTLANAVEVSGLVETLKGEGPFTVFAPTDEAFAAMPTGTLDALLVDVPKLKDILLYHVASGKLMAADVSALTSIDTMLGKPLAVTVTDGTVKVGDATIVVTDIAASNGVIHVIDKVLTPPAQ
jgi:transforming growth factor-beta-induced protein